MFVSQNDASSIKFCDCNRMLRVTLCFIAAVAHSADIAGRLDVMPYDTKDSFQWNRTTTAAPAHSTTSIAATANLNIQSASTAGSTTIQITTETLGNSKSSIPTEATSGIVSTVVPKVSPDKHDRTSRYYVTTTAVSPSERPEAAAHHFDSLNFIGGALLAISMIAVGTMAWKMYVARIERSYWTL